MNLKQVIQQTQMGTLHLFFWIFAALPWLSLPWVNEVDMSFVGFLCTTLPWTVLFAALLYYKKPQSFHRIGVLLSGATCFFMPLCVGLILILFSSD